MSNRKESLLRTLKLQTEQLEQWEQERIMANTPKDKLRCEKSIDELKMLMKKAQDDLEILENPFLDEKDWDKHHDQGLEKRADQADFFLDIIVEKELINLDKITVRKYFKKWFDEFHHIDLQIKKGDFAIDNVDIQTVPDFSKENIPEFLKWFENERNNFIDYLKKQGVNMKKDVKKTIVNKGNLIINENSKIEQQTIKNEAKKKEKVSSWSKAQVIIALIVGIASIVGVIWKIWSEYNKIIAPATARILSCGIC